jgi:Skp family chaperone for outer membrane proteins
MPVIQNMKRHVLSGLAVVVGLLAPVQAQAEMKIAIIDVDTAIASYQKSKDEQSSLQKLRDEVAKQIQEGQSRGLEMLKEIENLRKELREIENDPALAPEVKKQKLEGPGTGLQRKMEMVKDHGKKLEDYRNSKAQELKNKFAEQNKIVLDEITAATAAFAQKNGYDLVLNRSKENPAASDVVYAGKFEDITPKVLAELNAKYTAAVGTKKDTAAAN